jgi:S-adenosylmethionine:tRNA ribosyltransferase-isomerase
METREYNYELPAGAIAQFPLSERDGSRLLCRESSGSVSHHMFKSLPDLLPPDTLLIFNESKVLPARLLFFRETGAAIEVLLLRPVGGAPEDAVLAKGKSEWVCMVGNSKKWKPGEVLRLSSATNVLYASRNVDNPMQVMFSWEPESMDFYAVLAQMGAVPLPPYLNRSAEPSDTMRYQTVFAGAPGSVAAPTAGLHFSEEVLSAIKSKGIHLGKVTLHVGAGTFLPIKTETITEHVIHSEYIRITRTILLQLQAHSGPIVTPFTTAMRTLETLYAAGAKMISTKSIEIPEIIGPQVARVYSRHEITAVWLQALDALGQDEWYGPSALFIIPGHYFGFCDGLITNFHQPESTLLVLVEAFIGKGWKAMYAEALARGYRFLSYGDTSLLWRLSP